MPDLKCEARQRSPAAAARAEAWTAAHTKGLSWAVSLEDAGDHRSAMCVGTRSRGGRARRARRVLTAERYSPAAEASNRAKASRTTSVPSSGLSLGPRL